MSRLDRKYFVIRQVSRLLLVTVTLQLFLPRQSKALTTGPSQPEVMQFQQAGTSGMVDPFTGAFNYNIPLFELPGPNGSYPFNLAYQSGVTMDQEASWVGLGWSLNPGAITRTMRGLPDEFDGDLVHIDQDMKADWTVGVGIRAGFELFGGELNPNGQDPNDTASANLGLTLYYNSYRGLGYTVDAGASMNGGFGTKNFVAGGGAELSLDNQAGIGVSPTFNFGTKSTTSQNMFSLGAGYNSRRGLTDISLIGPGNYQKLGQSKSSAGRSNEVYGQFSSIGQATYLPAATAYSPMIDKAMYGKSRSLRLKLGFSVLGSDPNGVIHGYYNNNELFENALDVPAYGYLNLDNASADGMIDINREQDGLLRDDMPNLPVPNLTNDLYQISGQGTGGYFRAWRNDIPVVGNRATRSESSTGSGGFEANPTKVGLDGGYGVANATSGGWVNQNEMVDVNHPHSYGYHPNGNYGKDFERWYFKLGGDISVDPVNDLAYLSGEEPIRFGIDRREDGNGRGVGILQEKLEDRMGNQISGLLPRESYPADPSRRARNTVVTHVSNSDLHANSVGMGEYKIKHYVTNSANFTPNHTAPSNDLNRSRPDHHFAGMTVHQTDGSRYVYALPAYNEKQVENLFSVNGENENCSGRVDIEHDANGIDYKIANTDKYLHRTETPAYAHAHLLTSVLGQDYVDADDIPGPSDGDLGFWVKFNYVKVQGNHKWRAPFVGANFDKGHLSTIEDDKGSYMYGEREEWYLASAETKTHIAEFKISQRADNRGANVEIQNMDNLVAGNAHGGFSYRLDRVELYSKLEMAAALAQSQSPVPLTAIDFGYTYALCTGVLNNGNYSLASADRGKLTLQTVTFTHENSARGTDNPYFFEYASLDPNYDEFAQDKWGNYRPNTDFCRNSYYPYVDQGTARNLLDAQSAAWHLKKIHLPTGGEMTIDYEANDYAYVQDKPAMEMFPVVGMRDMVGSLVYDGYDEDDTLHRMLHVDLGQPLYSMAELRRVVGENDNVFLKTLINLKQTNDGFKEYVSSFLSIDRFGFDCPMSQVTTTGCSSIYILLSKCDWNGTKWHEYHPVAMAAWNYLRSTMPELISIPGFNGSDQDPGSSAFATQQKIRALASIAPAFVTMFGGYYANARAAHWAQNFDTDRTFVRLNHIQGKKVGGGCRVKRITLSDEFSAQSGSGSDVVNGVVYDYTMEENGRMISSGVAAYEPLIGGEENPLRQTKRYPTETPLLTPYNLFAQLPVNESVMPSPVIGYRKVTVKSLATQQVLDGQLAATVPTTGAAVHEFWTAKDFPVECMETEAKTKPFNLHLLIPFVGTMHFNDLTATQGYTTLLNDMHGKPKRVSNYGQDQYGQIEAEPINWVEYDYAHSVLFAGTAKEKRRVQNLVNVVHGDVDPTDSTKSDFGPAIMGQDHEFVADLRESGSESFGGGGGIDVEFSAGGVTLFWPSFNFSKSRVRTAVTNKIIHRSGILTRTRAFNQGSLIETKNILFDAQTGRPLLTTVTNDYNAPIYSYEYPAFWAYDGMGPAYKNIDVTFAAATVSSLGNGLYAVPSVGIGSPFEELLVPGDELVVTGQAGGLGKAIFIKFDGSNAVVYSENTLSGTNFTFRIIRSGRRNLLNVTAEQIVSLRNPTIHRGNQMCWRDIANPTAVVESTWVTTTMVTQYLPNACWPEMIYEMNHFFDHPASDPTTHATFYLPQGNPLGCVGCNAGAIGELSLLNDYDIDYVCQGSICNFGLKDVATNAAIPIGSIDHIANVQLITPFTAGQEPFSGSPYSIHVDVYLTGSSTPVVAYLWGCEEIFPGGTSYEAEVNEYHSTFTGTPSTTTLETEMFMLDSVLSATAQTFSDAWMQDYADVRFATGNAGQQLQRLEDLHPFANGQRGVWRPKDSYVYVTDRRQSTDINTAKDGTFSGMPMFDFQSITFDHCAPNWRKTNEVTRYSPYGNELENRDVLNVYSTALYGYNGKLPIAVSANADYREVGFESFEEYANGASVDLFGLSTGNLDFPTLLTATPRNVWTYTDIKYGSLENFYIDGSVPNSRLIHPIATAGIAREVQGRTHGEVFNPSVFYAEVLPGNLNGLIHFEANDPPYLHQFNNPPLQYAGRLVYERPTLTVTNAAVPTAVSYSDTKAHTGELSLKLKGVGDYAQNRLKLSEGESYTVQLWVSRANTDVPTYYDASIANAADRLSFAIGFFDAGGTLVGGTGFLEPTGELVEGWQKIEANFTVPVDAENIGIRINSGKVNGAAEFAYFDDIRIQPLKSKMTCYVYDPRNYKLRATLDDDNFALVYRYDEAGNLYLVQKETVEGMRTVQESRGFMIEN